MKWSFSNARAFRQCQRSWFFKTCAASARSEDELRHEAYLLSKLQSVSGWRGSLVDRVLSRHLVGAIRRRQKITKAMLLAIAKSQFDRELECALGHRLREAGLSIAEDECFAALRAVEYEEPIAPEEIAQAWRDVELAMDNLFAMEKARVGLKTASHLVAQRSLQFEFGGVSVLAVPDVVAFYDDGPPLIVDWKVHSAGSRDYRLQLALYAMALVRCAPHRDFPPTLQGLVATDIRLLEVQLLSGVEHEYTLASTDFDELEEYIAASAVEMLAARGGLGGNDLRAEDFAVTRWPDLCQRCPFKKICWETEDGPI